MSARISKTQASRNKLQGLIREAEILKAQHLAALKAVQTDAEYQALEDQIARQTKLINQLRVDVAKAQDGQIDVNTIASGRVRAAEAATAAARLSALVAEREVQNLNQALRIRDGKLFDYRVLTVLMAVGSAVHLGVKYIPGLF
ncbi:hypothetical protein SBWP25_0011 [Pseudomonas phage phi2]|uniref:Hypothetical phage protein n=1 Tax=Pseudomonas phage phi2 TaxID=1450169 RepID=D2EBR5_9CAUD|nr:hypothetical protein SBWP25_0011 [Pseudomonas phage phi-2]CBH51581.1 hypothetical phage protein [Pseudomonas phage phi-2]